MNPFIVKLLFNKYTMGIMIIISAYLYVSHINSQNNELSSQVQTLNISLETAQFDLSKSKKEIKRIIKESDEQKAQIIKISLEDCQDRIDIVKKTKDRIQVIDKVKEQTQHLETVDEKNILGTKLPDDILNSLRIKSNTD